jgi:hypothetical protein
MPEHYRNQLDRRHPELEVLSCALRPTFVKKEFVIFVVGL